MSAGKLLPWLLLGVDMFISIILVILFVSYQPDTGSQLACALGDQNSCSQLQAQAAVHYIVGGFIVLFLLVGIGLVIWGIIAVAVIQQPTQLQASQMWPPSPWPAPPPPSPGSSLPNKPPDGQ